MKTDNTRNLITDGINDYHTSGNKGRRLFGSTQQFGLLNPESAVDIKILLRDELRKWGMEVSKSEVHAFFATLAQKEAVDCFEGNISEWSPPDTSAHLGHCAIRHLLLHSLRVMTNDGKRLTFSEVRDFIEEKWDAHLHYAPYYIVKETLTLNGEYTNLQGINPNDLDPLNRFSYHEVDAKESLIYSWTKMSLDQRPGHIVEAAAIHEAVTGKHHCINCKAKDSMLWNSSIENSFSNVVCKGCGSLYTFCSTGSIEKLGKSVKRGSIYKGKSFASYRNEIMHLGPSSKMFVILIPKAGISSSSRLPAFASEIIGVQPALTTKSFDPSRIRFKCNILLDRFSATSPWFYVNIPLHIDFKKMSMDVIDEYFSGLDQRSALKDAERPSSTEPSQNSRAHFEEDIPKAQQVRKLRRTRNQIEGIKKRHEQGDHVEEEEMDLLDQEDSILDKLKRLEDFLRD